MQEPQKPQISFSQTNVSSIIKQSYQSLGQIKVSFRFLHDSIKEVNKLQLLLPAETKLIQIKKKVDQLSKINFIFYLKDSFMPSLSSKIGDLAQAYGRYDEVDGIKKYQITLACSQLKDQFG